MLRGCVGIKRMCWYYEDVLVLYACVGMRGRVAMKECISHETAFSIARVCQY